MVLVVASQTYVGFSRRGLKDAVITDRFGVYRRFVGGRLKP